MKLSEMIFTGIKGSVVALDRATGKQVWVARLKSYDFVSVMVDEGRIYAACSGEVFCLDPVTGAILWHNALKGYGTGLVSMATATGESMESTLLAQKRRRDQQTAAAAATAAS
jgi:outer membrane protein assembly factor BamB